MVSAIMLPAEVLEIVAGYLSTTDRYQALAVCKCWYGPFCRSLYRQIDFRTRPQFKRWLCNTSKYKHLVQSLELGHKRQEDHRADDCATGAIPLSSGQFGATSQELIDVLAESPLLESIQFDHSLWQYLNITQLQRTSLLAQRLVDLPALDHPRQLSFLQNKRGLLMSRLHLRGSDIFQLHKQDRFLEIFQLAPNLTSLIIDGDGVWDTKNVMAFTTTDMDVLIQSLPKLQELVLADSVRLTKSHHEDNEASSSLVNCESIVPARHLSKLHLAALIDQNLSSYWLSYLGLKFPQLTDLSLKLCSPYYIQPSQRNDANIKSDQHYHQQQQERNALASLISKLPQLKKLAIDGSMSKSYMHHDTLTKGAHQLQYLRCGLWGYDMQTAHEAFNIITTTPSLFSCIAQLSISILDAASTTMDMSALANCRQLVHLELINKARQQPPTKDLKSDTSFGIAVSTGQWRVDNILSYCASLETLEINGGCLATVSDIAPDAQHMHLKSLRINQAEINNNNQLFNHLSLRCPKLSHLFLRRCKVDSQFVIHMPYSRLDRIVLSELKEKQESYHHLQLLKKGYYTTPRHYKYCQDPQTLAKRIRRLEKPHNYRELFLCCQTVDQLIFNGCVI